MKRLFIVILLCTTSRADRLDVFADSLITPEEAERTAVSQGFGVRTQELDESIAGWSLWGAAASYLPRVTASSQYLRLDDSGLGLGVSGFGSPVPGGGGGPSDGPPVLAQAPGDTSGMPPGTGAAQRGIPNSLFLHEVSVQQPIFNAGREIVGLRVALIRRRAARAADSAARQDAILSARESYFNAVASERTLLVAENSLAFAERNLMEAQIRHESGVLPITDITRWRAQVAQSKAESAQAEAAVMSSRLRLLTAMGYRVDRAPDSFRLMDVPFFEGRCSTDTVPIPDSISIEDNPTVRAFQAGTKLSEQQRRLSITNYLPSLNAFYTRQWTATDGVIPENNATWNLGLILSVPVTAWLSNTPDLKTSTAELRKARIQETERMQQLTVSARTAALSYSAASRSLVAAQERRDFMQETVETMQARYEAGIADQTDLLDVALERDRARLAYVRALFECLLSHARYLRSIGKLEVMK